MLLCAGLVLGGGVVAAVSLRSATCAPADAEPATGSCAHRDGIANPEPAATGCVECLRSGDPWVHLRLCLTCGHVGCCDSSKNQHATRHFWSTHHPIVRSLEPGEDWRWCYVDEVVV
jgi:uncharacterized UBP type Zn finger protein